MKAHETERSSTKAAFTLVELMVVVGLMALLGTVSVTGYFAAARGMADRAAKQDTIALVRLAMQVCLIDQTPTAVLFFNRQTKAENKDGATVVSGEESKASSAGAAIAIKMAGRLSYVKGDVIVPMLDLSGWIFFVTSCISHSAILLLALWLIFFLPLALLKKERWAVGLFVGAVSILATMAFINMQVYKIYRFHINGFIINMITGPNAGDIFDFSPYLYLTEGLSLLIVIGICIALWPAAKWLSQRIRKKGVTILIATLVGITLIANGIHVYGSFVAKPSAGILSLPALVGILGAEVVSEAILRAVQNAESAYGYPSLSDLK